MPTPSPSSPASPGRRRLLLALGVLPLAAGLGVWPRPAGASLDAERLRASMQRLFGGAGLAVLDAWLARLDQLTGAELTAQLRGINDFFNQRVRWLDDIDIWGQADYWATPLETLGRGEGDCEDYSIAKYVSLKMLGVPGDRLRMIYVRARIGRGGAPQAHMVLGYYPTASADPRILDNLKPEIVTGSQRRDLEPVFSFNSQGLWTGDSPRSRADPLARLSPWRGVMERMREQGFAV